MNRVCPAPLDLGDTIARTCGHAVAGELAPGVGRCVYHLSPLGRLAELDARAVLRELAARARRRFAEREAASAASVDDDGTEWRWVGT